LNQILDFVYSGWTYWQFKKYQDITTTTRPATAESFYTDDGELEINKVRTLSRTYAQAIAGQPISMDFDSVTFRFELTFNINTDIHQPTIVYLNKKLNYPFGQDINISPQDSMIWNATTSNYYEFLPALSTKNNTKITIIIYAL